MANVEKKLLAFLSVFVVLALTSAAYTEPNSITWSPDTQLTTDSGTDRNPSGGKAIQVAEGVIWVVWASNRSGNYDIFYKTSTDGGVTWSDENQLTTDPVNDDYPSVMHAADGSIWIVWSKEIFGPPGPYHWDLFYTTSADGGATWSAETRLTTDEGFDLTPSITQTTDSKIWVVWASDRIEVVDPWTGELTAQDDLFYKTSSDGGDTWTPDTRLTEDPKDDIDPSITQTANEEIWIVWVSNRYGNRDLFYKYSTDGGATWSDETRLTMHPADDWAPSITQTADGNIWVNWHSKREANYDIYYKVSSNAGEIWSEDTRLTTDPNIDVVPTITQTADGRIWIVWASYRMGNYDLWYKTGKVKLLGDVDGDGDVDADDLYILAGAYGSSIGEPAYNSEADLDGDNDVDADDLYIFAGNYGKSI